MFKKLFTLLKLARKLALSDALKVVSKIHKTSHDNEDIFGSFIYFNFWKKK